MASAPPDPHPDSVPDGDDQNPEQPARPDEDGRDSVEDTPQGD